MVNIYPRSYKCLHISLHSLQLWRGVYVCSSRYSAASLPTVCGMAKLWSEPRRRPRYECFANPICYLVLSLVVFAWQNSALGFYYSQLCCCRQHDSSDRRVGPGCGRLFRASFHAGEQKGLQKEKEEQEGTPVELLFIPQLPTGLLLMTTVVQFLALLFNYFALDK